MTTVSPAPGVVSLRPCLESDRDFLYRVYASTRLEELAPTGWSPGQMNAFLSMQFNAQHTYYHQQFADAEYSVVMLDGVPIGRLYVNRTPDEVLIIDIALLPEYRDRGIGTPLVRGLLAEADAGGKPVRLHVEKFNRALRLWQRLGFEVIEDQGVYWYMERRPPR